jgi:nicotinamidase-related amidase
MNNNKCFSLFNLSNLDDKETLIVVIDMVNGFAKKGNLFDIRIQKIIQPINQLLLYAKKKSIKIIAFNDAHEVNSLEFNNFPPHCLKNSWESESIEEFKPFIDQIIYKNSTNSWFNFFYQKKYLNKYKNFIVVGCCTDICIYQFVICLKTFFNEKNQLNINVIVPEEMVATFDNKEHNAKEYHDLFLKSMSLNGINVVKKFLLN